MDLDGSHDVKAADFVELHNQVEGSLTLLSSLESFLATFQNDLSAVSGQIFDLQARSKDFDARLQGRRKVVQPLSLLISNITIPPQLALTILDQPVSDSWVAAVKELEGFLRTIASYSTTTPGSATQTKVKAAKDLEGVTEGLRIVAATKIRAHFLAMLQPLRTSITTNIQVLQSTIFLKKYLPLFRFLQRQAPKTADEISFAYVRSAKLYYETGMRRYTRSLGYLTIKANEPSNLIGAAVTPGEDARSPIDDKRLENGKVGGASVILAYMVDDKSYSAPLEAVFRSALLVLLDNSSAEFAFIQEFFKSEPFGVPASTSSYRRAFSGSSTVDEDAHRMQSELDPLSPRTETFAQSNSLRPQSLTPIEIVEERKRLEALWKTIFDPVLPYVQTLITSIISPAPPPLVPLLTMIRLTDAVLQESSQRGCAPLEPFLLSLRMQLWPLFQKQMSENVDSLKSLADNGGNIAASAFTGFFGAGKTSLTEETVQRVSRRYTTLFSSAIALSEDEEEGMLFSNLYRLRTELVRLISTHASRIKDPAQSALFTSRICDSLLKALSAGERLNTHPKAQSEVAFWRERDEEAARRIASAGMR